jgi:hydrogenase maturation protein HypF
MKKARILVQGIVQGVGFRPNVYRIAKDNNIYGFVRNLGNIVEIIAEGNETDLNNFIEDLNIKKPPISKINSLNVELCNYNPEKRYNQFAILESSTEFSGSSIIPPEIAVCDNCLEEIYKNSDRRYEYPFTACTDCGPRFTVIKSVPYDRERTSMKEFPLCPACLEEYRDVGDRRYHAEATCCPECGPEVYLHGKKAKNPIKEASKLISEGYILAIKGIGGTHLVAKTTDDDTLETLRKRLGRFNQPFACMSPDINTLKSFAEVEDYEEEILLSRNRPIVVLNKNKTYYLSPQVAPSLHNLGVMLPYSGLHHLLFKYSDEPAFIMTSANMPGEPMLIHNQEIVGKLEGIADYYLLHDRQIINRCDDSVIRFRGGDLSFIRRSRGYVPEPYEIPFLESDLNVLALGPEIDVTFSLLKEGRCYVSQHIGDTTKYDTFQYLQEALEYMMGITKTSEIDFVACDLHPMFFTTKLANKLGSEFDAPVVKVQHHFAHAAALAVDHNIDEMICIAADGVGYGADGTAWGGEIIHYWGEDYDRLSSLMPQKMPGGDLTTKYPIRMLMSMIRDHYDHETLMKLMKNNYLQFFPHGEKEVDLIDRQLDRDFNITLSTSTGRVLDSISLALGICGERTYEGECAMKLESAAYSGEDKFNFDIKIVKHMGKEVLDTSSIILEVLEKINNGEKIRDIACSAQNALALGLSELAIRCAEKKGIEVIGGSGGVFYNETISMTIKNTIEETGYQFIQHKNSCAGDGSVSLGQAVVAAKRFKC